MFCPIRGFQAAEMPRTGISAAALRQLLLSFPQHSLAVFLTIILFCGQLRGQNTFEIQLKEVQAAVYQVLELSDKTILVAFRNDPPNYFHALNRYDQTGKLLGQFLPKSSGELGIGKVKVLGGIAEGGSGDLWFADEGQNRLQRFASDGKSLGSVMLVNPSLQPHWLGFGGDGKTLYFGGCDPAGRGPYLGCKSLIHSKKVDGISPTKGFLSSDLQPGWKMSEKSHYRVAEERIAVVPTAAGDLVAYTNLTARRVWLVDPRVGSTREINLTAIIPEVQHLNTPQDAQTAYLSSPLITALVGMNTKLYVFVRNQVKGNPSLIETDLNGKILRSWASDSLVGVLVGRLKSGHLVFAYGNRLRCVPPSMLGKAKF
jgi:hypothetical protein